MTIYEPDAEMIFNYLMVSALAKATDIIEKKDFKATGGEKIDSFIILLKNNGVLSKTKYLHATDFVCNKHTNSGTEFLKSPAKKPYEIKY